MQHMVKMDHHGRDFIISSYSRTSPGYWVPTGTPVRLPDRVSDTLIGQSVRHALDASRVGVPMPKRMAPDPLAVVIDELGVPSHDDYVAGATSVDIATDDEGHVVVTPTKHDESRHHMSEIRDHARTLDHPDDLTLAHTIRACLDESE